MKDGGLDKEWGTDDRVGKDLAMDKKMGYRQRMSDKTAFCLRINEY